MYRIRGDRCRWLAPMAVVCLLSVLIVVSPPVGAIVVFPVGSETVVQGSSNGWGNEADDDGAVNVKTEMATGASPQVNVTLLPDGDGPNEWSSFAPCQTDVIVYDELNDEVDATCRNTVHSNPPSPPFDSFSVLGTTMQDVTPLGTVLNYNVTGIARIRQDAWQFAWSSAELAAPGCLDTIGDTGGSSSYVTVSASFELCGGSEWTEAQIDALTVRSSCPADPGSSEICYTTQHQAVVGITYGSNYSLNFTSHFANVVGKHLYLRWNCTTTDSEGLDAYVDGIRVAQGVCLTFPQGSLALPDIGAARGVDVILTSSTSPGDSTSSTYTFDQLVIVNDNSLPTAQAGTDQNAFKNMLVTLDGSASSDPDGDTLSYQWSQMGGPSVTLTGATSTVATFTPTTAGTYSFSLAVNDGDAGNAMDSVVVNVENQVPTANAGADQTPLKNALVTLNGSGSVDLDGDTLSYLWDQTAGPPVTLANTSTAMASFTPTTSGTYELTLAIDDGIGGSDTDSVLVIVQNRPPIADAGADQSGDPGASVTLDGGGSDPDGDTIVYAWAQEGGPAVTLIGGDTTAPRLTPTEAGTYVFRLRVMDAEGAWDEDTVLVRVEAPLPVAFVLLPLLVVVGALLALFVRARRKRGPKTIAPPAPRPAEASPEEWREETAGAGRPTAPADVTQAIEEASVEDTSARLAELEQMKADGVISDDYYTSKRKEILGKL